MAVFLFSFLICVGIMLLKNNTIKNTESINLPTNLHPSFIKSNSPSFLLENSCRFPVISSLERNIINNVALYGPLQCNSAMPNMARLTFDNKLIIYNELERSKLKQVPSFQCFYRGLSGGLKGSITKYAYAGPEMPIAPDRPTAINHSNIVVKCMNQTIISPPNGIPQKNTTVFFEKTFATFANFKEMREKAALGAPEHPSLAVLVLDSVARNQFMRHMPDTTKLMKQMGFIFLKGYTKIGDNSAVNLMPVLSGKSILPKVGGDGRELLKNDSFIDLEKIEFLWDLMKNDLERKCITMYNDDVKNVERGLFHYPKPAFEGFTKPPTDYYFRPYHLYNIKHLIPWKSFCLKTGQPNIAESLKIYQKFSLLFKHSCHFSFNFLTSLTHDDSSNLNAIDEQLRTILESFIANNVTENTVLVIMGDHGNRIGQIQNTFVGRIEERMPLFSIYLPSKSREIYSKQVESLKFNANRLTSNFDVYQILRDIAADEMKANKRSSIAMSFTRGTSLFNEKIPSDRSCEEAGIPPNFCVCMEERKLSRLHNGSLEFLEVKKVLTEYLRINVLCANTSTVVMLDEKLKVFSVNQMVRHGLRDANQYSQYVNIQAALEILYFNVNAQVKIKNEIVAFVALIKHYTKEKLYDLVETPIVRTINGTLSLLSFCRP